MVDMQPCTASSPPEEGVDSSATRQRSSRPSAFTQEVHLADGEFPATATGVHRMRNPVRHQTLDLKGDASVQKRHRKKLHQSSSSFGRRVVRTIVRRTWVLPLAMLSIFGFVYILNPTDSNPVHGLIFLSYRIEPSRIDQPAQYAKGRMDLAFVSFYIIVLSFTREFTMQEILRPIARYGGIVGRGRQTRFMEQAYTAIYFLFLGPFGLYVMRNSPVWYFNVRGMYAGFPHTTHNASFKFYYLFQAAYWAQQAIVLILGMEKRRKDFNELVIHHIVTLSLIGLSYRFHFTYMGIAVYITHDISDLFLAGSKVLNYLDSSFTIPFYASFVCVWIYLRHYINIRIIYSLFNEFRTVGPYELDWVTEQFKCPLSLAITASLLGGLQTLNLIWLYYYIFRVSYRIIVYNEQRDTRSDVETSSSEAE